jgi:hypothetical protein
MDRRSVTGGNAQESSGAATDNVIESCLLVSMLQSAVK